ncbi:MAG: response regulator [Anaerolineaceae bacterium]|nr:response regulator [Anaerolineaceae bacterium]
MPDKILIVDDDIDSLKLIGLMLQRQGYEVVAANSGNQALMKAVGERPNLIILDIMMPDMDGYEVCRRLRANTDTAPIPIIMFTAKTLVDDKVAGFEAGADDYLTKPTHPQELAARVKAILMQNAPQRPPESPKGSTIGVLGAKGGVGATTIALNIAAALTLDGEKPIVADFRLGSGSMGLYMGIAQPGGMATVLDKPASNIGAPLLESELISHQSGMRALLSSISPREGQLNFSIDSALAVVRGLRLIGRPAIFDLGSNFNPLVSRIQREMDQIVLVVEPNPAALAMAREALQELEAEGGGSGLVHVVVVNRAQPTMQTPWNEIEHSLGHEIRAVISAAPDLAFQTVRAGVPMVIYQPNAVVSSQIVKLAADLNERIQVMLERES